MSRAVCNVPPYKSLFPMFTYIPYNASINPCSVLNISSSFTSVSGFTSSQFSHPLNVTAASRKLIICIYFLIILIFSIYTLLQTSRQRKSKLPGKRIRQSPFFFYRRETGNISHIEIKTQAGKTDFPA